MKTKSLALAALLSVPVTTTLSAQTRTFDLLTASVTDIQDAVAAGVLTYEGRVPLAVESPDFDATYLSRLKNRLTVRQLIVDLMDRHQVDVLVHPFKSFAAPPLGTGDRDPRDNPISAITGLPALQRTDPDKDRFRLRADASSTRRAPGRCRTCQARCSGTKVGRRRQSDRLTV